MLRLLLLFAGKNWPRVVSKQWQLAIGSDKLPQIEEAFQLRLPYLFSLTNVPRIEDAVNIKNRKKIQCNGNSKE